MGALREKESVKALMGEISRLRKVLRELDQENLELSEIYEKLKKENEKLGLEVDRLSEEIERLYEDLRSEEEPEEPPF